MVALFILTMFFCCFFGRKSQCSPHLQTFTTTSHDTGVVFPTSVLSDRSFRLLDPRLQSNHRLESHAVQRSCRFIDRSMIDRNVCKRRTMFNERNRFSIRKERSLAEDLKKDWAERPRQNEGHEPLMSKAHTDITSNFLLT